MNWEALGAIGEVVGAAAVVVTLAYLAVQIRQNTRAVKANTSQAISASRVEFVGSIAESSELSGIFFSGLRDRDALEGDNRERFDFLLYKLFAGLDNQLYQYGQGGLPLAQCEHIRGVIRWYVRWPGVRLWWKEKAVPFGDGLTEFVDSELQVLRAHSSIVEQRAADRP